MDQAEGSISSGTGETAPVFVSYATADRKKALAVCKAIERRGTPCWISCRDVPAGENYQEAIVSAIRQAPAMVLVFSDAANNSDEIKKELSLVSRYRVPVLALRIEDVEPSDAFAYELSTRQWVDAFEGWDRAIDAIVQRIEQVAPDAQRSLDRPSSAPQRRGSGRRSFLSQHYARFAAALAVILVAGALAWWFLRPANSAAQPPEVRLAGFQRLSPELPPSMPDTMREEIIAAFSDQAIVGVSTAPAPPAGTAPAYALGGTIRQDGDNIKVIARLTNERSGATLWSNSFSYARAEQSRVPRAIALKAGNLARCGLFGASTYSKPLPDPVLTNYLQFCHHAGMIEWEPRRALDFANKVVATVPDFSWGWSAVAIASLGAIRKAAGAVEAEAVRKQGLSAADKAIELDPSNSEAFTYKSRLIDQNDLVGREALLKRALAARPLACGCEHHVYGALLEEVGRNNQAIDEYRRAIDVLALTASAQSGLWGTLLVAGRTDEAEKHLEASVDLMGGDPAARAELTLFAATMLGDPRSGLTALKDPALQLPKPLVGAIGTAFTALQSGSTQAKSAAAAELLALPDDMGRAMKIYLLALVGRPGDSLRMVEEAVKANQSYERSQLFTPALASARADPGFPGVLQRLGLIRYWRQTKTRPDFCSAPNAPAVCQTL